MSLPVLILVANIFTPRSEPVHRTGRAGLHLHYYYSGCASRTDS